MLLVFVVPQFTVLFDDMGAALPLPTRIVVGAGDLFRNYWWAMLARDRPDRRCHRALAARRPEVRERFDRRVLAMPLFGDLVWKMETARFCSHPRHPAQERPAAADRPEPGQGGGVATARSPGCSTRRGRTSSTASGLAGPLARLQALPQLALQMIRVGEESGALDAMLAKVAEIYDRETRTSVQPC